MRYVDGFLLPLPKKNLQLKLKPKETVGFSWITFKVLVDVK
jgi:uncharacterized protein YbaA (DUF1428 family)